MFKYVKWCSSVWEAALGSFFRVKLSTRRYSETKFPRMDLFLASKSTMLSTIHFLISTPTVKLNVGAYKC